MAASEIIAPLALAVVKKSTLIWAAITGILIAQETIVSPKQTISLDPVTITLIGGMIVTIIGTVVTGIVTIITALRVSAVGVAQAVTTTRLDAVASATETIKGHVNSEKTASDGRENTLRQENRLLREMMAESKQTAALLAQSVAGITVAPPRKED